MARVEFRSDVPTGFLIISGSRDILVQNDTDYPGVAAAMGWVACECGGTDGTVDCEACNRDADTMIAEAGEWIRDREGASFPALDQYFGTTEHGYTLPPWTPGDYTGDIYAQGKRIAAVTGEVSGLVTPEEAEANRILISSAPELLDACKAVVQWASDTGAMDRGDYDESVWQGAVQAIAQATGEAVPS